MTFVETKPGFPHFADVILHSRATDLYKKALSPHLKTLSLRNLGSVPKVILRNSLIRYLYLNHV
jgi:hypothetical protein